MRPLSPWTVEMSKVGARNATRNRTVGRKATDAKLAREAAEAKHAERLAQLERTDRAAHQLLAEGRLPGADAFAGSRPAWTLQGIAEILGTEPAELVRLLAESPPRFQAGHRLGGNSIALPTP